MRTTLRLHQTRYAGKAHVHHHCLAAVAVMVLAPGCITPLDESDEIGGTTDADPACYYGGECNGVEIYCKNHYVGGADETGGLPNYWWVTYDPEQHGTLPSPELIYDCSTPGVGEEHDLCKVCDDLTNNNCVKYKEFNQGGAPPSADGGGNAIHPNAVPVCLGDDDPIPDLDPIADWMTGNYPEFDDEVRMACSARCLNNDKGGAEAAPPECEDENWSGLQTAPSWTPAHGHDCVVVAELNLDDPDASEFPWNLVGGPSSPVPLDCDLNADCVDWFTPNVAAAVLTPGLATFIEPETRQAHYLAVENGSSLFLEMNPFEEGQGAHDTEALYGLAEYTSIECGDDVCPFYLANLSAYNTSDSWELALVTDLGDPRSALNKSISDVQIDLLQSTLGVQHMGLGQVMFAPGALRLRIQVTVENDGQGSSFGNGTHAAIVENDDYVFGEYDDGDLAITYRFPFQGGTGTVTIDIVPDEYPPVPVHDLDATEACDDPAGLVLDSSYVLSTDPDNDIVSDLWYIDGVPCGSECILPFGTHQVMLEAQDARGAVQRTSPQAVYVATGCSIG